MDLLKKYIEKKEHEKNIVVKIYSLSFDVDRTLLQEAGMKIDKKVEYIDLGKPNFPPVVVLIFQSLILYEPTYFYPENMKYIKYVKQLCQLWNITKIPWNSQLSIEDWLDQVILLPPNKVPFPPSPLYNHKIPYNRKRSISF